MFAGENARRLDVVRMCDNCRVDAVMNEGFDPYAGPGRPVARTTEDYLRERQPSATAARRGDHESRTACTCA